MKTWDSEDVPEQRGWGGRWWWWRHCWPPLLPWWRWCRRPWWWPRPADHPEVSAARPPKETDPTPADTHTMMTDQSSSRFEPVLKGQFRFEWTDLSSFLWLIYMLFCDVTVSTDWKVSLKDVVYNNVPSDCMKAAPPVSSNSPMKSHLFPLRYLIYNII